MATRGPKQRDWTAQREEILLRLSQGESLRAICKDERMPTEALVRTWVVENVDDFGSHYARARDIGLETLAEEIIEIANTPVEGETTTVKADGGIEKKKGDMIEHRRLQIDARKWYLSKLAPKKYGDRLQVEATVGIGDRMQRAEERLKDDDK